MNHLAVIRKNGYEIYSDNNAIEGFAAPIFNDGHCIGSVGVYMPTFRVKDRQYVLKMVLDCAERINNKISSTKGQVYLH